MTQPEPQLEPGADVTAAVERAIKPTIELRMEREHVRSTIESPGWRVFFDRAVRPVLAGWRRELLTNVHMTLEQRNALVQARSVLLEGFTSMYEVTGAHIPEWFEKVKEE
jgi:hypothetical protein